MNKQTKHTPGPWGVEQTEDSNWVGPLRSNSHKINEIVCSTDREGLKPEAIERNDANARLIAAAPELLAACKVTINEIDLDLNLPLFNQIQSAINKAEASR